VLAFSHDKSEEFLNEQRRFYDEYIAFVDAEFGRFVDFLDRSGVLEDTYFIVTSDHGQLFEREIHGHVTSTLYEPLIHIPLLISKPGQKEREDVLTPTSSVDLLPTLAHIAGKPFPDWCEGQILPTFHQTNPESGRSIYTVEAKMNPKSTSLKVGTVSIMKDRYKLVHYFGYEAKKDDYEFYDLENDPEELEDLYPSRGKLATELKAELLAKLYDVNRAFEDE
jgi:arylsulfatase